MAMVLEDPLRAARRAVHGGRFRQAWDDLAVQPEEVRRAPEWHLLAAMSRWRLGEFAVSRLAALRARDGYRAVGDGDGEMRAENVAAAGAFALGDLREAERGFRRAFALADRLADELMLGRAANNLGNVAFYRGEHEAALSFYRLAEAGFGRLEMSQGVAETVINTGIVWRDLDYLQDSMAAAERALDLAERIGSRRLVAQALAMRGEALAVLGDRALGRAQVERALDLARAEDDRMTEIEALRILGNLLRVADPDRAERLGLDAVRLAEELSHTWAIAETNRDLGELYLRLARREEAATRFEAAARAFASLGAAARAATMRERAAAAVPR